MEIENEVTFDEDAVARLVAAFYRHVRSDEVLSPLYPDDDWEGAEKRLRDFLVYRFGGSDAYIRDRGHPRLGMRHAPFKIGIAERDRWLELMNRAIIETNVPKTEVMGLKTFFENVANFLRNA